MIHSVTNSKNFFIKANSTLPELKFSITQKIKEKYNITGNMLENVAVTFSMIDADTGIHRVANAPANLAISRNRANQPSEEEFTLTYRFTEKQTKKPGRYLGEFCVDFLLSDAGCGKFKLPINGYIDIIISDSLTKTTVI